MSDTPQQPSRMALIREQAAKGALGKTAIVLTGRKILSIDKLVEDPENERKTFDDMDDMVASIKAVGGVIEPLTVIKVADDRYQLITGHRRLRAAKLAGLAQIEVLIREPEEKWERRKKSLISNVQRADIRALELAESLKLLLENDPKIKTNRDLAAQVGKSEVWVNEMLRILDLPSALKGKLRTSEVFLSADAVSKIARVSDQAEQRRLVDALLSGATVREIRERINVYKGKGPKEAAPTPKPKWVFHTEHGADIIVQSKNSRLSLDERIAALEEALTQAKAERGD